MRDGTILDLVVGPLLGLQKKVVAQPGGENAPEISWYIFPHQTPCIHFSLIQKKKLFGGGYRETGTYIFG